MVALSNWSMHQVQITITDGVVVARETWPGREDYAHGRFKRSADIGKGVRDALAALAIEPLCSSLAFPGSWRWSQ